jgi:hypothetical protein
VANPSNDPEPSNAITRAIIEIVSKVPSTSEQTAIEPKLRSREIVRAASLKAAAVSGAMTLTPGPLGMLTVLPDLYSVWRIQAQMVADIAAAFGKSGDLSQKQMLYCLFRHAAAQLFRDVVTRVGERFLFRRATLQVIQSIARALGVRMTQKVIAQSMSRWLPAVGAAGMAGYAAWDTHNVGRTAVELFSNPIVDEDGVETPATD